MEQLSNLFGNKDLKHIVLFLLLLTLAAASTGAIIFQHKDDSGGSQNAQLQLQSFNPNNPNIDFQRAVQAYKATPSRENLAALIAAAQLRKSILQQQIRANPGLFMNNVLPISVRKSLPAQIQPYLEQDVKADGTLGWFHQDNFWTRQARDEYSLYGTDKVKQYTLRFVGNYTSLTPREFMSTRGVALDSDMVVTSLAKGSSSSVGTAAAAAGSVHATVLLLQFHDDTSAPSFSADDVKNALYGSGDHSGNPSVTTFYQEVSFGSISFTFDLHGFYILDMNTPDCSTWSQDEADVIADAGDRVAQAHGIQLNNTSTRIYLLNSPACLRGGGSLANNPRKAYPEVWLFGQDSQNSFYYSHELGHNLGLQHASSEACATPNDYTHCDRVTDNSYSKPFEYGDHFDVMGYSFMHFNAPHKIALGVIPDGRVQTIISSGTYVIAPLESQALGIQVLKIKISDSQEFGNQDYYYVEYRRNIGIDGGTGATGNWVGHLPNEGASIHIWNGVREDRPILVEYDNNIEHAMLDDGDTFFDRDNSITIKQVSHDAVGATVTVEFGDATSTPTPMSTNATATPTAPTSPISPTPTPSPEPTRLPACSGTGQVCETNPFPDGTYCPNGYSDAGAGTCGDVNGTPGHCCMQTTPTGTGPNGCVDNCNPGTLGCNWHYFKIDNTCAGAYSMCPNQCYP